MSNGFTDHDYLIEIKEDLKDFRAEYTKDQAQRSSDLAKRPTRGELWSLVAGATSLVALALALGG